MTMPSFAKWKPRWSGAVGPWPATSEAPHSPVRRAGPRDRARPANLITMVTPIRPGGRTIVRRFFDAVRHFPAMKEPLRDMALIRAAHWTVVESLPDGQGDPEPLRPAYLLFESTYDVDLSEYIDQFARTLPWQMRAIWLTGSGYPGVLPSSAFYRWVDEHSLPIAHSWRAYPEATTRMVGSGLRVEKRLAEFDAAVARCTDEEFAFEFRRLLVELQEDL